MDSSEVYADGGDFEVPHVNDHFDQVKQGPAPKKTESLTQNTKDEGGSCDWITKPVSSAWEWTKETASIIWDWFVKVLEMITSIVIVVGSFLKGVGEAVVDAVVGIWDVIIGIWNIIVHPIDSVKNIINAIMHPIDMLKTMWKVISDIWKAIYDSWMRDVLNGDANSRANWFGYAFGQVLLAIVGTKGADKLTKMSKGTKIVEEGTKKLDDLVDDSAHGGIKSTTRLPDNMLGKNDADPFRDIYGPGRLSHPDEWNKIIKQAQEAGVEVRVLDRDIMAYAPKGSTPG